MVKRIEAYISEVDGRMFLSRAEATYHETRLEVTKALIEQGCNDALAGKICGRLEELALILEPLARELRKDLRSRGIENFREYFRPVPIQEDKSAAGS